MLTKMRLFWGLVALVCGSLPAEPVTLHWKLTTSGPSVDHGSDHYGIFAVAGVIENLEGYAFTIAPDNTSLAVTPKGNAPKAQVFSIDALNGNTTTPGNLVWFGRKSTYAAFGSPFTIEVSTAFEPTDAITFVVFNAAWFFSSSHSGYALLTVKGLSSAKNEASFDLSGHTLRWEGEKVPAPQTLRLPPY